MIKTVEEIDKKIAELEKEKLEIESKLENIPITESFRGQLAILLHEYQCKFAHEDQCGWYYEISREKIHDWSSYSHKSFLSMADRVIKDAKLENIGKNKNAI